MTPFVILLAAGAALVLTVASAGAQSAVVWRHTFETPGEGWEKSDFDDTAWKEGPGGFGNMRSGGTDWGTQDIYLRRSFELERLPDRPALFIFHDDSAEIYLNGAKVASFRSYMTDYNLVDLSEAAAGSLRVGPNVLAVHCHQDSGGQYIDVHVVDRDAMPDLSGILRQKPPTSELMTVWGADVTSENVWLEYPRPQMVRDSWTNLNGEWDYQITAGPGPPPSRWHGKILVPFCVESRLSGVGRLLQPFETLWYRRAVDLQPVKGRRILLHFGAVDYRCQVFINRQQLWPEHTGGNLPFSFDITRECKAGLNEIIVRVIDATNELTQSVGKQSLNPEGERYTRVSGIWQTVWIEEVPDLHFRELDISSNATAGTVTVRPKFPGGELPKGSLVKATLRDHDKVVAEKVTAASPPESGFFTPALSLELTIPNPVRWSPTNPRLYDIEVTFSDAKGAPIDKVSSYVGLRALGTVIDGNGQRRFTLNGEPIFHFGAIDQGWWPDGLLTPPSDEALRSDIEFLKGAGFNTIRKHMKVEPQRFYYHCDRLGMMVWQDHVSGGGPSPERTLDGNPPLDAHWSEEAHERFMDELNGMVDALDHFPSVVMWIPFHRAGSQHRSAIVAASLMDRDPSRHVNIASGGNGWPVGHVLDRHHFPEVDHGAAAGDGRATVCGAFGGLGWTESGHEWNPDVSRKGYGPPIPNLRVFAEHYRESLRFLSITASRGLSGAVYLQASDVETDTTGLRTYDRKFLKIPLDALNETHQHLLWNPIKR